MTIGLAFPRWAGSLVALALAAMSMTIASPGPALAQFEPQFFDKPWALNQWTINRRLDESQLRYCVDQRDPDWEVAAAIADSMAQGLLLEPQRYVVEGTLASEDITQIYAIMIEHCDLFMGFKLIPNLYDDWVTLTRPYYEAQYVFVTTNPGIDALADLAPFGRIGAALGTQAHIRLVAYNSALPAAQRWAVYPLGTNELALQSLVNGSIDLALVWAPALWAVQQADPAYADLRIIDSNPLPPTGFGVGGLLLSDETFLRTAFDEAIAALRADGTIASILEYYGFPATAGP